MLDSKQVLKLFGFLKSKISIEVSCNKLYIKYDENFDQIFFYK